LELRYLSLSWRPMKGAEEGGAKYAEAHDAHSLTELRAMPWQQLIAAATFLTGCLYRQQRAAALVPPGD